MTEEVNPVVLKIEKLRAEREAKRLAALPAPEPEWDVDLIPEDDRVRTEEQSDLDKLLNNYDIVKAYRQWCNKSPVKPGNKRESIKVSCPNPDHPDAHPSAWLNRDKNTWYCGSCDQGGDSYDIGAWHYGFEVPSYKKGESFHKLRQRMAEGLGYHFVNRPGLKDPILVGPSPVVPGGPDVSGVSGGSEERGPVDGSSDGQGGSEPADAGIDGSDQEGDGSGKEGELINLFGDDEEIVFPTLDWKSIVEPDTFLAKYMEQCSVDDIAEEYHFWNGLLGLGFIAGRDVVLDDYVPVLGNLFVCLLGHTGDGKSRSYNHLSRLFYKAMPYVHDDETNKGVEFVKSPASAEVLVQYFSKPVMDPIRPKVVAYYAPVRGLVEFNELSGLTGRAGRMGNTLKPTLMEFYDGAERISTASMGTGRKIAHHPFASAFTSTQPRSLKDLVRQIDADSGFLNRWVFASGKSKKRTAVGGVRVDIDPIIPYIETIRSWIGFGKKITWDDDALEQFETFFHEVLRPVQLKDDSGMLTRLDLLCKKLVLLFCINEKQSIVTGEIVRKMMKMFPYLVAAYGIPTSQIGNSVLEELKNDILRHVERHTKKRSDGITLRDLCKCMANKKYPVSDIHKMIKILTELDFIQANKSKQTVRYSYVG